MADIWINVDSAVVLPLNILPLVDDTDFKTIRASVSASSLRVNWNFCPTAGSPTRTTFSPGIPGGPNDMFVRGEGLYTIEIPATGGSLINNDSEGLGWFSASGVGVLPFRSPLFGFRAAILNDNLIDNAHPLATGSGLGAIEAKVDIVDTNVDSILTDTGTAGVIIAATELAKLASASRVEAIQTTATNVMNTKLSGSYLSSLASASRVEAIQTTATNIMNTKLSGSYIGALASASRVEAIQADLDNPDQYKANVANLDAAITSRLSGSYIGALASASRVEAIQTEVDSIDTDSVLVAVVEDTYTMQDFLQIMGGVLAGIATGGGTSTITFNNISNSGSVVKATVDTSGNRTEVLLNVE